VGQFEISAAIKKSDPVGGAALGVLRREILNLETLCSKPPAKLFLLRHFWGRVSLNFEGFEFYLRS
jgi:hypothetical protein